MLPNTTTYPIRPYDLASCAIGYLLSTSSDAHQVVEIYCDYTFRYSNYYRA